MLDTAYKQRWVTHPFYGNMEEAAYKAKLAASLVFKDLTDVRFIGHTDVDGTKFEIKRQGSINPVSVVLNPNGTHASVEWNNSRKDHGYRVFRLMGAI